MPEGSHQYVNRRQSGFEITDGCTSRPRVRYCRCNHGATTTTTRQSDGCIEIFRASGRAIEDRRRDRKCLVIC